MISLTNNSTRFLMGSAFLFACVVMCSTSSRSFAQQDYEALFLDAQDCIALADYSCAQEHLETLAGATTLKRPVRQNVLKLLGVVYTIQGKYDLAKATITTWIENEPPYVAPDPEKDMLEFVQLYYEARRDHNIRTYCPSEYSSPDPCEFGHLKSNELDMAVIQFQNNIKNEKVAPSTIGETVSDLVITHLSSSDQITILDREYKNWILQELEFSQSDAVSAETALTLGRIIGARTVLVGDVSFLANTFILNARLIEVETTRILFGVKATGKEKELLKLINSISEQVASGVDADIDVENLLEEGRLSTRYAAILAVAEGLDMQDRGDIEGAIEKYEEALEIDPAYLLARQKLEAARLSLEASRN